MTLKLGIMLYSVMLLKTIAQESASWLALRNCYKEKRDEPGYMGVLLKSNKQNPSKDVNIKTADQNCRSQKKPSQVNDFDAFIKFCGMHALAKTFFF